MQNKYRQQTDEVNQLQEQGVMLKVELATFQEKCRLTQEEVAVCRFDFECDVWSNISTHIYIYEDDLHLGKLKENCFTTQALSQTQKTVSEPPNSETQKHSETFFSILKTLKILKTFF